LARVVDQSQDAGDHDAVRRGLLGVPPHELRRRVKYERVQHAVGLGEVQGAVQSADCRDPVPGCIAGDGLEQKYLHHPGRVV
jgi:DNA-binding transcriptional regulator YdaS (Cro superfamily)